MRKEVKDLVRQKNIWNEVIERANAEGSRKEFWAFVSRRSKGKKNNIANEGGISVTSTQGEISQSHYERWRLRANVSKSAVMVFSKASTSGEWKWGVYIMLPKVSNYAYLGVNFASNGGWDSHVKDVCVNGRKKLNQLHSILSNRILICVHIDCCYCLLFDLALSMVVQFGIVIRIRLVL